MKIGLRAHDYGKLPVEELLKRIKNDGFQTIQLAIPKAIVGVKSYYEVDDTLLQYIANTCKKYDIEIAVLGCYINPALMDENMRRKEIDVFLRTMEYVKPIGASFIGTETTHFTYAEARREEVFNTLVRSVAKMVEKAEHLQVDIGIEPVASHTLNTPELTKKLLDTIQSDRLKIIFDPVNLLTIHNIKTQEQLWERCFEGFGEKICALHMKGIKVNQEGLLEKTSLKQGEVDFSKIIHWIEQYKPGISLLREEISPSEAQSDREYISSLFS